MQVQETLTKENFWNEMMATYPKATKLFCDWIDEYKKAVYWNSLFSNFCIPPIEGGVKFHNIPYAMQQGIWIEFVNPTLGNFFEQPEYTYSFDLAEDIKTVFQELEPLIDNEPLELNPYDENNIGV